MKEYVVYFEIFGKKLKLKVKAYSEMDAMHKVKNKAKIKFYKCEESNDMLDLFKDIFK